jgi:hypothetical protein
VRTRVPHRWIDLADRALVAARMTLDDRAKDLLMRLADEYRRKAEQHQQRLPD